LNIDDEIDAVELKSFSCESLNASQDNPATCSYIFDSRIIIIDLSECWLVCCEAKFQGCKPTSSSASRIWVPSGGGAAAAASAVGIDATVGGDRSASGGAFDLALFFPV
jgi:hypothetical protein